MLKYSPVLAYTSFSIKNLSGYFTTEYIIKGFLNAFLISLFIYLNYFGLNNVIILKIVNSITAILGFYLILKSPREILFWSGIFIGLLWFYWIGFSFRYYDASYAIPFMIILMAFVYGTIFWFIGIFHVAIRAFLILFISYLHPFNFNWFIPELTLLDSFFGIEKWQFALFLLSITLFILIKNNYKYLSILPLLLSINFTQHQQLLLPNQKIYLSSLKTPQEIKWKDEYRDEGININLNIIDDAISKHYDTVVISESAFPIFLNMTPTLMERLKKLSMKINIVTGGLYTDGKDSYNSTYYFIKGKVQIANKVVLVPFGEEVPLPSIISKQINKFFYNGADDYIAAKNLTDIEIDGEIFRNAICYEATREELFVNNPKFMIAMSNNAWFTPSIEPTLQHLLLRYFSRRHKTVIFHSANMSKSEVIR